ncbi:hypothetical protein M3Y94_00058200 [Aphelenchoides besseyi]|nr:hypothetical protein M3Y94_00058200 [Aphelenchoides besseyi]
MAMDTGQKSIDLKVHKPTVIEIQGLRGVAIMAVLLFHLWDKTFEVGYLGVDIFFVISGYLMCSILNAKAPLSFTHVVDFYFRRIKRIIPTYLFVIYCCLFAAIFLISSTDYRDLVAEAKKPFLYISNWPDTPEDDYFAEKQLEVQSSETEKLISDDLESEEPSSDKFVGFFLIAVSIAIGYLIEEAFKCLNKWLINWFRLLAVVCVLYLANGVTLWYLKSNEIGFNINATQRENGPEMEIRMKAIEFFENRNKTIETDPSLLLKYSRDFSEAAFHFWYCNKSVGWQSNYKEFSTMGDLANNSCTVTDGNGTKTIVVFGNSHARTYMPGIMHAFRDVYSNITLLFRTGCFFLDAAPYQVSWLPKLFIFTFRRRLIIGLTHGAPDTDSYDQLEKDPIYRKLEKDLAALSAVARDVVMLPNVQLMTGLDSYMSKWRKKIANREGLEGFEFPIEASLKNYPRSREHLAKVNCSKCAKMNWEDLWCNRTTGMCNSVDPVSHLNYFYDKHHPTYFGSIFFVISGYLMCLILSRKRPINLPVCVDFYYRRVKRIVPLYFTVILVVLVVLRHVISPIEFTQLYEEAIPALGFYSNIPNMREAAYFDISSELYYFLHSWSLSVELQFYLIVPLIFVFFDRIEKLRLSLRMMLIVVIPITSFIFQCYASKDFAHMLLPARIWQFFVGFDVNKWIDSFKMIVVHVVLILLLVFSLPIVPQLQRLFVVVLTGVVVGSHCETSVLSNLRPIITLGDISYSVYLIHWPLFTWHKYAHSEIYTDGGEPSVIIENVFKWLMKRISGWSALSLVLCILLWLNGIQLLDLRYSSVDLNGGMSAGKSIREWKQKIRQDIEMLWAARANPSNFTEEEVTKLNTEQLKAASVYCDKRNRSMPTNYPLNMSSYTQRDVYACHAKGNGTKNIVVIGNSHAFHNFPGIAYIFRLVGSSKDRRPNNMETDELYLALKKFYTEIATIPREALIVMESFPRYSNVAIREVEARMSSGKKLDMIGDAPKTPIIPAVVLSSITLIDCLLGLGSFYNAEQMLLLYRKTVG